MLYKVFMGSCFTELTDKVGFIEAQDVEFALDLLATELTDNWSYDAPQVITRSIRADGKQGQLTIHTKEDGVEGDDIYMVQEPKGNVAIFCAQDWNLFFELDQMPG